MERLPAHRPQLCVTPAAKQVERKPYSLADAVTLVQKIKFTKFDETVEVHMRLGVDPKHADQDELKKLLQSKRLYNSNPFSALVAVQSISSRNFA
jgi:hypothetical protein